MVDGKGVPGALTCTAHTAKNLLHPRPFCRIHSNNSFSFLCIARAGFKLMILFPVSERGTRTHTTVSEQLQVIFLRCSPHFLRKHVTVAQNLPSRPGYRGLWICLAPPSQHGELKTQGYETHFVFFFVCLFLFL